MATTETDADACPICDGPLETAYRLPHICSRMDSKPFRIRRCRACDLGLYLPRPGPEELSAIYATDYYTHHAEDQPAETNHYRKLPPPSFLDRLRLHLAWRLDRGVPVDARLVAGLVAKGGRVCDVGCGGGQLLAALKQQGFEVVGVEPDARAREASAARGIEVHPGYAEALPEALRGRSFDAVAMLHTLEHCPDPLRAVREAAGLVRPGSVLVVEVPNNGSIVARSFGPSWFHADYGRHLNFFTSESLAALLGKAGLVVERFVFSEYVVHASNERIAEEQGIWDWYACVAGRGEMKGAVRNSRAVQWWMLARTMFRAPSRKYGIVGVIARKPESEGNP